MEFVCSASKKAPVLNFRTGAELRERLIRKAERHSSADDVAERTLLKKSIVPIVQRDDITDSWSELF